MMKVIDRFFKSLGALSLLVLLWQPQLVDASQASSEDQVSWNTRVRGYQPMSTKVTGKGFAGKNYNRQEFTFTFIVPLNTVLGIGIGYTILNADATKKKSVRGRFGRAFLVKDLKASGSFSTHLLELSIDYKRFAFKSGKILILTTGVEVPIGGNASTKYTLVTKNLTPLSVPEIPKEETQTGKDSASSPSGFGVFFSVGLTLGKTWEGFFYQRERTIDYGVEVQNINGGSDKASISVSETGIGLGFTF